MAAVEPPGARFDASLSGLLLPAPPAALGLAVSGGSDSTALMHLARDWAAARGITLHVATVDHGLRPEAAAEAASVARAAAALELPHETLAWQGRAAQGNLMDAARRARLRLLGAWARGRGLSHVLLGHTRDDLAEGLLIGLTRGAGLDGLSAMRAAMAAEGVTFLRPLLDHGRAELRAWLTGRGLGWIEDPSNADPRYLRARSRTVLAALAPLGLDAEALARSARLLRTTRKHLDSAIRHWAQAHVREQGGDLVLDPEALAALGDEPARRFLNAALRWVAGAAYPPRAGAVVALLPVERRGRTLHGCLIRTDRSGMRIGREPEAAARAVPAAPGTLWDGRWQVAGPFAPGQQIRATGPEGLAQRPDWRRARLPRATLLAAPAVWQGAALICAPLIDAAAERGADRLGEPPAGQFVAAAIPTFLASLGNAD